MAVHQTDLKRCYLQVRLKMFLKLSVTEQFEFLWKIAISRTVHSTV